MARAKFKSISEITLDILEVLIIGTTVFVLVYLFVGQLLEVSGESMYPTLEDQEQIIAEKVSLAFKPLEQGEIVTFEHPEKEDRLLVKRVIALPGDTVMITGGNILVNDEILEEPYLKSTVKTTGGKAIKEDTIYTIPQNSYLLLGDNRKESSDSRTFGPVNESLIMGRAFLVYKPLENFRVVKH